MKSTAFKFARLLQREGFSPVKILGLIYHAPKFIRLFSRLLGDPRVPFHLKALCYGSLIYLLFPIDLIKDLPLVFIGYVDDVILIFLAFRKLVRDSPPEVVQEHVQNLSEGR